MNLSHWLCLRDLCSLCWYQWAVYTWCRYTSLSGRAFSVLGRDWCTLSALDIVCIGCSGCILCSCSDRGNCRDCFLCHLDSYLDVDDMDAWIGYWCIECLILGYWRIPCFWRKIVKWFYSLSLLIIHYLFILLSSIEIKYLEVEE